MSRINLGAYPGDPPEPPDPPQESLDMCEMLEAAGVDQETIDKACKIVESLCADVANYKNRECPQCEARQTALERQAYEDFKNDPYAEDKTC